ncbi:MAG: VanZ family protein [Halofilum sp. (in: g-proteobacteria)]|nr:VanZ family protein [Halofilum sp. (in: g-proteobacteria)]
MTTEPVPARGRRRWLPLGLWLANVGAILLLTLTGGPLRSGLLRIVPEATVTVGWLVLAGLALAFAAWLFHAGRHAPPARSLLATAAVAAMLAWALTIHLPSERMHLLLFGTLGLTATAALGPRAGLVFVLAWAGVDELIQLYLPDRVADWTDVGLNAASAVAGWLVAFAHRGIPARSDPPADPPA